jgi:hypothetical protein
VVDVHASRRAVACDHSHTVAFDRREKKWIANPLRVAKPLIGAGRAELREELMGQDVENGELGNAGPMAERLGEVAVITLRARHQ